MLARFAFIATLVAVPAFGQTYMTQTQTRTQVVPAPSFAAPSAPVQLGGPNYGSPTYGSTTRALSSSPSQDPSMGKAKTKKSQSQAQTPAQPVVNDTGVSWYNRRDPKADAVEVPVTKMLNERQMLQNRP